MNLTEIIAASQEIAQKPENINMTLTSKLTMSVLVLLYLLGRDTIKYFVPLLRDYIVAQNKLKLS
jgi:hypothetical protein